jgi:23S rRNA (adenine2503-C2)-methyltransferase
MKIIKKVISKDGRTIKYLQQTRDRLVIETSYFNLDEHIICISTQIGCMIGCIFCATSRNQLGKKRFVRNLTDREIVQQVKNIINDLGENKLRHEKILFSYMGMGEPLLNYKNVIKSIKTLTKQHPNSRVTISTSGIVPKLMKRLAKEKCTCELKLHLSLHAPNDKLRKQIMPRMKEVKSALNALKFFSITKKTPAKVNYLLINKINDSKTNAKGLATLLKDYPFIVKLSRLNSCKTFKPSTSKTLKMFERILRQSGVKTCRFFRRSHGSDIQAGCGQLRLRNTITARRKVA